MLVGEDRYREAGLALIEVLSDELASVGLPADPADVAGALGLSFPGLHALLTDRAGLDEVIRRWDTTMGPRGFPRVILMDHGDEIEFLVGREAHTGAG
jgi:hypothetical protein